jgi:hypothetical protein
MTIYKMASVANDNPPGVPLLGGANLVRFNNVLSSTAAAGFPISNVGNPATHLFWKAVFSGSPPATEFVQVTSLSTTIDYIGIAGHNFGSANITVNAFDGSVSPPTLLMDSPQTPPDNSPIIIRFPPGIYGTPTLALNLSAATAPPQMAVLYVGKLLILERGIKVDVQHTPINMGRKMKLISGMS